MLLDALLRPTARAALHGCLAQHVAKLRGNESDAKKRRAGPSRGDFSDYAVTPCLPPGTFSCAACGSTFKADSSDQPIIDHVCSNHHNDALRDKGLTSRYYFAPGIAMRDAERKVGSGRKSILLGLGRQRKRRRKSRRNVIRTRVPERRRGGSGFLMRNRCAYGRL